MSEQKPKISVITASFNSGSKLVATCASVAGQDVEFEHLIMDGLSTDGSLELAHQMAAADNRIRVHSEKDTGVYDALNKSIALARGDYLYFLGAGDVVYPESFKAILGFLPADLRSFVYGECLLEGRRYDGEFTNRQLIDRNICHQGIFYGREVFKICGQYDCKYRAWADWDFNERCFGNPEIKKIFVPILIAEFETGGVSGTDDAAFYADHTQRIRKHFGLWMVIKLWLESTATLQRARFKRVMRKLTGSGSVFRVG
jgi:glycosyltransferase involved in cell wall biosynthesis